eukprot:gene5182-5420_t
MEVESEIEMEMDWEQEHLECLLSHSLEDVQAYLKARGRRQ